MGFESIRSNDPTKRQEMPVMTPELQAELAEIYNIPLAKKPERDTSFDVRTDLKAITQEDLDAHGIDYKIDQGPEIVAKSAMEEGVADTEQTYNSETIEERDTRFDARIMTRPTPEQIYVAPKPREEMVQERDTSSDVRMMPIITPEQIEKNKPKKGLWQRFRGLLN